VALNVHVSPDGHAESLALHRYWIEPPPAGVHCDDDVLHEAPMKSPLFLICAQHTFASPPQSVESSHSMSAVVAPQIPAVVVQLEPVTPLAVWQHLLPGTPH